MNDRSSTAAVQANGRASREELLKEFRVKELLDAARRVIGRHGFQGTTIDRVAEEAHVAKGTVYLYFTNKDDLLFSAVIDGIRAMNEQTFALAHPALAPLERLRRMVRGAFRLLDSNQDFLKALIIEPSFANVNPDDPRAQQLRRVFSAYLDFAAAIIRDAIDAGQMRPLDPQHAAFMLDELVIGSLRRRMLEFASGPIEADADAVLDLFFHGTLQDPTFAATKASSK
ncbi:MAG TPA: TetR family transcriptional regulator [Candidatus Binataceae bacterium]|jgi:AcrR family transcriptional regulator